MHSDELMPHDDKVKRDLAISDGAKYVLKPQREGGGNNLYNQELSDFLCANKYKHSLSGINKQ